MPLADTAVVVERIGGSQRGWPGKTEGGEEGEGGGAIKKSTGRKGSNSEKSQSGWE